MGLNGRPKVKVQVLAEFDRNGKMLPKEILWVDENEEEIRYPIDEAHHIGQAPGVFAGGQGEKYMVRVNGQSTYLFFTRDTKPAGPQLGIWFVERRTA